MSDAELIVEFRDQLAEKYPEYFLGSDLEDQDSIHLTVGELRAFAHELCSNRKLTEIKECFELVDSFYCRSHHELLNAIYVSFLEWFPYEPLTDHEFRDLMPETLFQAYLEMVEYMTEMARDADSQPE